MDSLHRFPDPEIVFWEQVHISNLQGAIATYIAIGLSLAIQIVEKGNSWCRSPLSFLQQIPLDRSIAISTTFISFF